MGKKIVGLATFGLSSLIPGKAGKLIRSAILIGAGIATGNPQLIVAGVAMGASALKSTKGPKVSPSALDRLSASIDPRTARKGVFGDTALNTDIRDQEYTGTNNEYLHRFVVVASHKVTSVREIWFDDKQAWTAAGGVQGEFAGYLDVATVLEGNAGNAINISARMGNTRRFTGCGYVHFRYKLTGNDKKTNSPFASSIPSRLTIIGEGMPVYDPRYDSTVPGGSGPARADDQTTWQYSYSGSASGRNPACQTITYLLGWRIQNPVTNAWKLALGKGQPVNRIDVPSFITGANLCDEAVTLAAGGTEPRYRSDGVFSEFDQATDVLDNLKATMGAELDDMDGLIRLTVLHNDLAVPVLEITADDVLGDYAWNPFASLEESRNVVRGSFPDPSTKSLYQLVPYPDVRLASPDGIERAEPVNYQFVQSVSQAQRLSKQRLQRAQYAGTFSASFKSRLWRAQKNDVISFTFGPTAFVSKLFRIVDAETKVDGIVPVVLREEHPDIYLWDADESPAVVAVNSTPYTNFDLPVTQFLDTVQEGADVTADHVAGDFVGRGALATENYVVFDGGFIKEPLTGGGTATATKANYRTDQGTAADFAGRGALATLNAVDLAGATVTNKTATYIAPVVGRQWAAEAGADVTSGHTAADFTGRGALATLNAVDMATTQVTGKTAANIAETTTLKWAGESGADVTGGHTAADFTGRGALATLNAVDLSGTTVLNKVATNITETLTRKWAGESGADITGGHTAADFTGRGALATLNAVALDTQVSDGTTYKRYATTEQTKLAGVAAGATVGARSGTNLYRTDGTTVMTQAEVRTIEGTAADFTGRGALATLNAVALDTQVSDGTTYKRYATTEQTKLAGVATGATVGARSGTNLYRTDGTTVMTQAEVRTIEGTAADFTGRGALATLNAVALDTQVSDGTTYKRYATTEQTKLAGVATGATVGAQSGTNLYRTDGTTVMTQAEVRTIEGTAADFTGRGALATLNAVDLAGTTVTNKLAANIAWSAGGTVESLKPAEAGANVTLTHTAADFTGRGALATLNAADFSTQITGSAKPADNAGVVLNFTTISGVLTYGPGNRVVMASGATAEAASIQRYANNGVATFRMVNVNPAAGPAGVWGIKIGADYFTFHQNSNQIYPLVTVGGANTLGPGSTVLAADVMQVDWDGFNITWRKNGVIVYGPYGYSTAGVCYFYANPSMVGVGVYDITFAPYTDTAASRIMYGTGSSVASKEPAEVGANVTGTHTAADFTGRGALATLNAVDLAGSTVTNKVAGNITWAAGGTVESLKPAEVGANVTGTHTAADFTGRGALATQNTVNLSSQTTGVAPVTAVPNISALNLGYKFSGTVSYSATSSGTATISVGASSVYAGDATINYNAMSANVSGYTAGTSQDFWLYVDDATKAGGTQTLQTTTNSLVPYQASSRVYIGYVSVFFPASGSGSGGGTGGGGGGLSCPAAAALVETPTGFVRAADIEPGALVRVLTPDGAGTEWALVTGNQAGTARGWRIVSASGVAATVSETTPITLRDGEIMAVPDIAGHALPVFTDRLRWEACTVEFVGQIDVAKIECGMRTFAAGDVAGASILTHNPKP